MAGLDVRHHAAAGIYSSGSSVANLLALGVAR